MKNSKAMMMYVTVLISVFMVLGTGVVGEMTISNEGTTQDVTELSFGAATMYCIELKGLQTVIDAEARLAAFSTLAVNDQNTTFTLEYPSILKVGGTPKALTKICKTTTAEDRSAVYTTKTDDQVSREAYDSRAGYYIEALLPTLNVPGAINDLMSKLTAAQVNPSNYRSDSSHILQDSFAHYYVGVIKVD